MWELYLITRLGIILPIALVVLGISAIVTLVVSINIALGEGDETINKMCVKWSARALAISLLVSVALPSKKDMLLIWGVGTTLDYLQDNEKVQRLPDKCVDALEAWVESLS